MAKIIINAENGIFGRICSYAAKQALEGNEIIIVNSERAIISGNKSNVIGRYSNLRKKGGFSQRGPKRPRASYEMLKRGIRGMLPDFRWGEGRDAFKRIKCYNGIPKEFEKEKMIRMPGLKHDKYVKLKEVSEKI
jgi:large subunit ribosomal protein L13